MADRDKYQPKHPTPGAGTRASSQSERDRMERLHGGREEDKTPVNMPLSTLIGRTDERTKGITTSAIDIQTRVGKLEEGVGELRTGMAVVGKQLDLLVEESKESRRERQAREEAAAAAVAAREAREERQLERDAEAAKQERELEAKKAEAERAFRVQRWVDIIKILAPIIAAVGVILAAAAGAFK